MDCSPPGSSVHVISQARILEWVPSLGALPHPGIKSMSPALEVDSLPLSHLRSQNLHPRGGKNRYASRQASSTASSSQVYSARARRVIALANPQKGVRGLFGSSGKFSRLDALGENGGPSRWFPKGKGYCVTQTGGDATGGGEGGSRAIKSRCGFSNPLREASQSPTVT